MTRPTKCFPPKPMEKLASSHPHNPNEFDPTHPRQRTGPNDPADSPRRRGWRSPSFPEEICVSPGYQRPPEPNPPAKALMFLRRKERRIGPEFYGLFLSRCSLSMAEPHTFLAWRLSCLRIPLTTGLEQQPDMTRRRSASKIEN